MHDMHDNGVKEAVDYCMLNEDLRIPNWTHDKFEKNLSPELLHQRREKAIRDQLKSTDGNTGEIYDQFYRDHKLLLKLFVYLGVMPLERSSPGVITFNWKSAQMVYAVIFYALMTVLVLRVGYERVKILSTTKEFDEYIYAVIFILFLVPHFFIPFTGWGIAGRVATYKTMWAQFQVKYYRVTGESLTFPRLNMMIIILFIGCVVLTIFFLYSLSCLLDGFLLWHTTAYFHIITTINMYMALMYINGKAIRRASTCLSLRFEKDINTNCNSILVSEYRALWLNLSEILQNLGSAYTRTYVTFILFLSLNIIVGAYGSFSEVFDNGFSLKVLGMLILTIYCVTLLFVVCVSADNATETVAQNVQHTLLTVDLLRVEIQTQREIDYFISAIALNPPVVNMNGYGSINRELLSSLIAKIAVYLIVLLQFKLILVAQNAYGSVLAANHE